ncbi:LemA family protein [Campylobacter geochelonis]|uniref:LemA family protein n=1 Tax=Campylobacter geochelonis TaxID=1780362 RepID=A0A128ECG9_9BACT|nr:LemA family protein [Campylobacter geochelonis]QKF70354.1 LemA protein [Campylobacter geochelonis]CZE46177.1 LemA family protein [Campylobacter geochelonis]CZE46453.1 LemA family protein [Campylobacter geochelonis]CZE50762.1 LemA family protein [Campylobacter geochelonis]
MSTAAIIFLGAIIIIALAIISTYNSLVGKRNQVKNIRAGVDTQLKKRYDLIPNLVSAVKEYLTHEKETLTKVTELRSKAMSSTSDSEAFSLNNQLSKLLGSIQVAIEAYPELKANENVMHLQSTLNEVEEQISAARRAYNSSVMIYNNAIEMFPSNIIANLFNFTKDDFFAIDESEKAAPNVSELFKK